MDVVDHCSPLIWSCYEHEEGLEELKHSLQTTTWELEMTLLSAKEEISRRECDLINLKELLRRTVTERDEAILKCQSLQAEKKLLLVPKSISDSSRSSSRSESNTSPPEQENANVNAIATPGLELPEAVLELISDKPLPEKGKLLQAVMEAGPLLETVLLAGPLPQWEHRPPQLNFNDIPLVSISINPNRQASFAFKKEAKNVSTTTIMEA